MKTLSTAAKQGPEHRSVGHAENFFATLDNGCDGNVTPSPDTVTNIAHTTNLGK